MKISSSTAEDLVRLGVELEKGHAVQIRIAYELVLVVLMLGLAAFTALMYYHKRLCELEEVRRERARDRMQARSPASTTQMVETHAGSSSVASTEMAETHARDPGVIVESALRASEQPSEPRVRSHAMVAHSRSANG